MNGEQPEDFSLRITRNSPTIQALLNIASHPGAASRGGPVIRPPVIIVAGGTGPSTRAAVSKHSRLLTAAFCGYSGTIISGGTSAGVCGIVGHLQEINKETLTTVGYLPATLPLQEHIDVRYSTLRRTDGSGFSIKEPLRYWNDIIASGIPPARVKLIGIGGGKISAAEYRIALRLGAIVGILQGSGGAADELTGDPEWNGYPNLVHLPRDPATLRAFIGYGTQFARRKGHEELAKRIHEEYRKARHADLKTSPADPSLLPWEELDAGLQESNRNQAFHIVVKVQEIGYRLKKTPRATARILQFSRAEIEHLAELEHGRWNAERLLAGWKCGPVKDVAGKTSPYIVPWKDLPDDIRELDRQAVRQLSGILASAGYGLCRDTLQKRRASSINSTKNV